MFADLLRERWFWVGLAAGVAVVLFWLDHLRSKRERVEETYAEEARRNYGRNS